MSNFLFCYRAPENYSGSADTASAWMAWFEQLGANVIDPGEPVFRRSTVGDCGAATQLGGYSVITADDVESAITMATGCPGVADGFGVEVGELTRTVGVATRLAAREADRLGATE